MADKNKQNGNEMVLMIEGLYNGIAYDLQKMKKELATELKYTSLQVSSSYESFQDENKNSAETLKEQLCGELESVKENVAALKELLKEYSENLSGNDPAAELISTELKYGYQQNQMIFESLEELIKSEVVEKLSETNEKLEALEKLDEAIATIDKKFSELEIPGEPDYEAISETVKEKVVSALPDFETYAETIKEKVVGSIPVAEEVDYEQIVDSVAEKTEASVALHSKDVLDAVAAIPVPENIDYTRIIEEVGDKVFEKITEYYSDEKLNAFVPVIPEPEKTEELDYDRVIYGVTEKVVESLPYPEKIDYARIEATKGTNFDENALIEKISEAVIAKMPAPEAIDYDALAEAVIAKMPAPETIDYDALAEAVIAKMPAPETVDYEAIADTVVAKLPEIEQPEAIDYEAIADAVVAKLPEQTETDYEAVAELVASKIVVPEAEAPVYDIVVDEEGAQRIAEKVVVPQAEKTEIDYVVLANEISEKLPQPAYEVLLDENGAEMIAEAVAEKLKNCCVCTEEAPVSEEVVEEEEPVSEEIAEEPAETVESEPAEEEIAVAEAPETEAENEENNLTDAEDGLVVRLKKSFEAKLRQSTPEIKAYYSQVKNELTSYKRLNSNLSWHGDRFNYGRETVARLNINGKTLCLYLALDPANPEFKTTVYHQKDLSAQKAYENTPFMVKIKSDTAARRAVRLVGFLAGKLEAVKNEKYELVDFVEEFGYASTQELIDAGLIKVTKEKKVALNFN